MAHQTNTVSSSLSLCSSLATVCHSVLGSDMLKVQSCFMVPLMTFSRRTHGLFKNRKRSHLAIRWDSIFVSLCVRRVCWVWNFPCSALYVIVCIYTHTFSFQSPYTFSSKSCLYQFGLYVVHGGAWWGCRPCLIHAMVTIALNPYANICYPESRQYQIHLWLVASTWTQRFHWEKFTPCFHADGRDRVRQRVGGNLKALTHLACNKLGLRA